ncbi:TetR family transcriptional regulator [Frankia sp. CcI49]|nr:TetR family transcriptional regulator [Frankia sp. CcI49]
MILEKALASFRERGYDQTTMRGIAQAAGVSLGNAYYYFGSKEQLVQELYAVIQAGHRQRAAEALQARDLSGRLRGVLHAGIDEMTPYHAFAGSFIRVAISPDSTSSPFSADSAAAREAAIGLFREVVDGPARGPARGPVDGPVEGAAGRLGVPRPPAPPALPALPELLWLSYLGITLFWVYDGSPGQVRTRRLVDSSARLIGRTVPLARLPVLRSVTDDVHRLLTDLRSPPGFGWPTTARR